MHVEQVLGDVPREARCRCNDVRPDAGGSKWPKIALLAVAAGAIGWMVTGCCSQKTPVAQSEQRPAAAAALPANEAAEAAALARANGAVDRLAVTLRGRLLEAMAEGGPEGAVRVCADEAQAMAATIASETGVELGRTSTKLRNPVNAPRTWVEPWLARAGEKRDGLAVVEAKSARVIRPIFVEASCLACHGDPASIPPAVAAVLAERYPSDQATGYAVGDLRGAFWAEVPVR